MRRAYNAGALTPAVQNAWTAHAGREAEVGDMNPVATLGELTLPEIAKQKPDSLEAMFDPAMVQIALDLAPAGQRQQIANVVYAATVNENVSAQQQAQLAGVLAGMGGTYRADAEAWYQQSRNP